MRSGCGIRWIIRKERLEVLAAVTEIGGEEIEVLPVEAGELREKLLDLLTFVHRENPFKNSAR